eukprot:2572759-Rhodomonas_salina.1
MCSARTGRLLWHDRKCAVSVPDMCCVSTGQSIATAKDDRHTLGQYRTSRSQCVAAKPASMLANADIHQYWTRRRRIA